MIVRPFSNAFAVTPSDSTDLTSLGVTGLRCTVAGAVTVDVRGGNTNVAIPLAAGIDLQLPISKVYSTGTTATGIVALVGT